jgi:hypothetical protein
MVSSQISAKPKNLPEANALAYFSTASLSSKKFFLYKKLYLYYPEMVVQLGIVDCGVAKLALVLLFKAIKLFTVIYNEKNQLPGANVIKTFTAVIYRFSY